MTSVSTRFIIFSLLISFLVCAASTSFTGQFILDIFGNPIKDLKNTFVKPEKKGGSKTSSVREDLSADGANPKPKMIDVPRNIERCGAGLAMDVNGVCRQPW
uniref:Insect cytokine uENF1 n=1 Tax=Mamestra brassicae TaxID=55057 RepID=E1CEG9_MAMBR|nr:insect cytokine precursor uENF1 [Mamestra brassicae]